MTSGVVFGTRHLCYKVLLLSGCFKSLLSREKSWLSHQGWGIITLMCNHNQRMEETHVSTEPPEIGLENGIISSFLNTHCQAHSQPWFWILNWVLTLRPLSLEAHRLGCKSWMFQVRCMTLKRLLFWGLPRWCSGKESACQCRRHKRCMFNPWVRKIPWNRKWQPTPVLLPGKFHEQRSLAVYAITRSRTGLSTRAHTHTPLFWFSVYSSQRRK